MIPGRSLPVFLNERERNRSEGVGMNNSGMMLSAVEERDEDFS
jgi:hypothetical protein